MQPSFVVNFFAQNCLTLYRLIFCMQNATTFCGIFIDPMVLSNTCLSPIGYFISLNLLVNLCRFWPQNLTLYFVISWLLHC